MCDEHRGAMAEPELDSRSHQHQQFLLWRKPSAANSETAIVFLSRKTSRKTY